MTNGITIIEPTEQNLADMQIGYGQAHVLGWNGTEWVVSTMPGPNAIARSTVQVATDTIPTDGTSTLALLALVLALPLAMIPTKI